MLGELQQATLLAVARLGDEAYAGAIRDEIVRQTDRRLAVSTVHVTLVRLEEQGLVASRRESSGSGHPGKPRRYFTLTAPAVAALKASRQATERLWEGVSL